MTGRNAFYGKPKTFEYTMLFKCFHCIMRAGRCIAALGAYPWRNDPLIKFDQYDKRDSQYLKQELH
jgi:hypothetical protein